MLNLSIVAPLSSAIIRKSLFKRKKKISRMNCFRSFTLRYFLPVFDSLQLAASEEELKELQFLRSVVAPLVEAYWVSACGLLWLRNQSFSGKCRTLTDEGDGSLCGKLKSAFFGSSAELRQD